MTHSVLRQALGISSRSGSPVAKAGRRPPVLKATTGMLFASSIVYIALRVWSIWTPHLWGDELFNYSLSQGSWITLFKRLGLDMAHPPLFYVLLKPWIYIAQSSMSGLRVFTVAISVATIVPLILLGRELGFRTHEIALALGLLAVNNYLIVYSYYLRPYSLLLFLTVCSNVAFVRFLRRGQADKNRSLLILTIINVLFVYTHYFAWLVVAAQCLWVAFTKRRQLRQMTAAAAIIVFCFLPWVAVIVYVSSKVSVTFWGQASWDRPPDSQSVLLLLRCFNGGFQSTGLTIAGSAVFLLLAIVALTRKDSVIAATTQPEGADLKPLALLAWLAGFPLVVSFAVAYALTWKWVPRYVIVSIAPYLLLLSACAFRLRTPAARALAVGFLLGWATIAGLNNDLAETLHGPNAPSYLLAQDLSRAETRTQGPIPIYGLSPYAEQGLRLGLSLTGEQRFKTIACRVDVLLPDDYFWIALTEHDPLANARVKTLASDPAYSLGEPLYRGAPPQRHILIPVRQVNRKGTIPASLVTMDLSVEQLSASPHRVGDDD